MLVRDRVLDSCENVTGWTALGNDTSGPYPSISHVMGTRAIAFNKVDGAANTVFAGLKKDVNFDLRMLCAYDRIAWILYNDATTNVAYSYVRLGTDASNYAEYRFADSSIVSGAWTVCSVMLGQPTSVVGTGLNQRALTHIQVGVAYDAEGNTGSLIVDEIFIARPVLTQS